MGGTLFKNFSFLSATLSFFMLIGIFSGAKTPIEEFDSVLINESFESITDEGEESISDNY